MRAMEIVVPGPCSDFSNRLIKVDEQCLVQKLITQAPVEAFVEPVLHWLTERDEIPGNLVVPAPGERGVAGQLSSIVARDHARLATPFDHRRLLTRHALARDRRVRGRAGAFLGHVVEHVQDTEASTVGEPVIHEVARPAGICLSLDED